MRRSLLVALVLAGVWVPPALACNEPSLGSVTPAAAAGDPVSFSAIHLDSGAAYTVSLTGRTLASGTATEGTIGGSFTMPDLGSAGVYYLELRVAHDGGTWLSSQPIRFVAPATPAAAPQQETAAKSARVKPTAPPAMPVPAPASSQPSATPVSTPVPATHARPAPAASAIQAASKPAASRLVIADPRSERWGAFRPATRVVAAPPAAPVRADRAWELWLALGVGACALIAAAAAALGARRRRAAARLAAIEAELQEMIAEARAAEGTGLRIR